VGTLMDGAMIFILGEGWKEFKDGTAFHVRTRSVLDKTTLEEEIGCAENVSNEIASLLRKKAQTIKASSLKIACLRKSVSLKTKNAVWITLNYVQMAGW
jgi:hypothetical protein